MVISQPTAPAKDYTSLNCRDGCGAKAADMSDALAKAWALLPISGSWRCPACARALAETNAKYTGG